MVMQIRERDHYWGIVTGIDPILQKVDFILKILDHFQMHCVQLEM